MKLSKYEKETILRFCEDPEEPLTIFTCSKSLKTKLMKRGARLTKRGIYQGEEHSWTFEVGAEWFREPRPRRTLSAEQKASRMAARAKKQS